MDGKKLPQVIVIGNEKGGSGKSTLSIHLAISYLYEGYKVATVDLDGRQGTLTRYVENRVKYCEDNKIVLPIPEHLVVTPSSFTDEASAHQDEKELDEEIKLLKKDYDILIIDTPGTYNHLSNAGHKNADILVTPVNDSLVDIDVLAKVKKGKGGDEIKKSPYAKNVEEIKRFLTKKGIKPFNWIVLRNRVSHTNAKNKKNVNEILTKLSKEMGFRYLPGIGERVIYREMFLKGLTIVDVSKNKVKGKSLSLSHIAAKNELITVLNAIGIKLPKI